MYMRVTRAALVLGAGILFAGSVSAAGVDPADACGGRKANEIGKYALRLTKAHGRNAKRPDAATLSADVATAQARFAQGFDRAEFTSAGQARGCDITGDVGVFDATVNAFVDDVLSTLAF